MENAHFQKGKGFKLLHDPNPHLLLINDKKGKLWCNGMVVVVI